MLFAAAGPAGQIVAFVFAVGLPVQLALAALLVLGRRIGGTACMFVPAVCLATGIFGGARAIDEAIAAVGGSADPAWIPWFAVQDRARACAAPVLGATAALMLALPPLFAAAALAVRSGLRWWAIVPGGGAALVAAGGMAAVSATVGSPAEVAFSSGAVLLVAGVAALAVAETAAPRSPLLLPTRVGGAGFLVGGLAVLAAHVSLARGAALQALPDFEDPFGRVAALVAQSDAAVRAPWVVLPALLLCALGLVPGIFFRRVRGIPAAVGLDAVAIGLLVLALGMVGGWAMLRWNTLGRVAGDHAAAVLEDRGPLVLARRVPVPARVLRLEPAAPRWIVQRERGGVEVAAGVGALEDVARALQRGDGLVLNPDMSMEDLYFTLADVVAGELVLVGCAAVPPETWARIQRDPLLAVGHCGGLPISFRVTEALEEPTVLIALKDRYVDHDGDVHLSAELAPIRGDVLLRAQVDATVADFVAVLDRLGEARRVYLAWGVTLEGDFVPVGVNPGLGRTLRAEEAPAAPPAPPNGESNAPPAAPTSPAPS